MRTFNLFVLGLLLCSCVLGASEPQRQTFVNAKISAKQICLNEIVRLEFTTMPREVEGVDITQSVANSLRLGAATTWRLVGEPMVSEELRGAKPSDAGRSKPVTVTINLLPRVAGDLQLPDVPITWMKGNNVARFDIVTVNPQVMIIGTARGLPREVYGVAGYEWSLGSDEVSQRSGSPGKKEADGTLVFNPVPNLTLNFKSQMFASATLDAPGLTRDQARTSFLQRWGVPHEETDNQLVWILGWTRITANITDSGIRLNLVREDVEAQLNRQKVSSDIFGVLDGGQTPEQVEQQRVKQIENEVNNAPNQ